MQLRKSHRKKGPTEKGFFVEAKKRKLCQYLFTFMSGNQRARLANKPQRKKNERRLRLGLCKGQNPSNILITSCGGPFL